MRVEHVEHIEFWKADDLEGVRVLSVARSRHLWTLGAAAGATGGASGRFSRGR